MKEPVPHDLSPMPFLGHLKEQMGSPYRTRKTIRMIRNPEEINNAKTQEDEGDMDFVQPYIPLGPVHDKDKIVKEKEQDYVIPLNDSVMQPLTPQTVHIIPPDDSYVAPATNHMSNKQLNKFEEEFSHITEGIKSLWEDRDNLKRFLLNFKSQYHSLKDEEGVGSLRIFTSNQPFLFSLYFLSLVSLSKLLHIFLLFYSLIRVPSNKVK
ncbi:hypothetical protein Tco_0846966 [Tanacetum coccineum]